MSRTRNAACAFTWLAFALAFEASARAETTVVVHGIGTQVGAIDTHVDRVTYSDPVQVDIPGVGVAYELRGTVSGVGWGGTGIVARAVNAHYDYQVPFVARWLAPGGARTVVIYHHGGGPTAIALAQRDLRDGPANVNRFAELLGDNSFGSPALLNHAAYISMNRRGMTADGRFAAKYLTSEVPPLTQAEVDAVSAQVAPGYIHPDLVAGAPVPAAFPSDAATYRDFNRALQEVVGAVSGTSFRWKIFVGNSAGSLLGKNMEFGCSVIGTSCMRTGGNHVIPYDTSSPRIFDGYIFNGFVYVPGVENADAQQSISAPAIFLQGRGDDRYQFPIQMSAELKQKGVQLDGAVWIYEVANTPHVARDNLIEVPTEEARHAEAIGPYAGAAIRNLRDFLDGASALPRSRIAGRIVDGRLRFDVAVVPPTFDIPVREDLVLDNIEVTTNIARRSTDAAMTDRWLAVTEALPHENREIVGPTIACRVGKYTLRFGGAFLEPFSPEQLAERYHSFGGYLGCVRATLGGLDAERLYQPRVENAAQFSLLHRALFTD